MIQHQIDFDRRVRAGSSFLYRPEGVQSQVFEVRMKERITDTHVFAACRKAFHRFPYLTSKLKLHDDGFYYLDKSPFAPNPQRTRRLRPLGSVATEYHIVDITMWGSSIFVSFHHALCDGLGIMQFIKTLVYYYLSAKYPRRKLLVPGVRLEDDPLLQGETADPVSEGCYDVDEERVFRVDGRGGFRLPEVDQEEFYCRWELECNESALMVLCKANGCTPAAMLSMLMNRAVSAVHPEAEKVVSNVVCDWRAAIGLPNTFRNCVSCVVLPWQKDVDSTLSLPELGSKYRELFRRQREINSARHSASVFRMLNAKIESLPDYAARCNMMGTMAGFINDTLTLSYLGRADFGDLESYIDGIHVYTSGDRGMTLEITALDGRMTLDLKQSFRSSAYVEALVDECRRLGLTMKCSGRIDFETPKDVTRKLEFLEAVWHMLTKPFSSKK